MPGSHFDGATNSDLPNILLSVLLDVFHHRGVDTGGQSDVGDNRVRPVDRGLGLQHLAASGGHGLVLVVVGVVHVRLNTGQLKVELHRPQVQLITISRGLSHPASTRRVQVVSAAISESETVAVAVLIGVGVVDGRVDGVVCHRVVTVRVYNARWVRAQGDATKLKPANVVARALEQLGGLLAWVEEAHPRPNLTEQITGAFTILDGQVSGHELRTSHGPNRSLVVLIYVTS